MPSKKKKYNARFPAGRIKKIMQTDEEVGKVAQAVPIIISRTLELFVESLLTKSMQITMSRNAKTLTPSHMKQCILSENRFDFLKDLVKDVPDASIQEDNENNAMFEASKLDESDSSHKAPQSPPAAAVGRAPETPTRVEAAANFCTEQSTSTASRTPVIQFVPKIKHVEKRTFSISSLLDKTGTPKSEVAIPPTTRSVEETQASAPSENTPPPLAPISQNFYTGGQSTEDNLCIDEDYDN